jgi:hypothetical protein
MARASAASLFGLYARAVLRNPWSWAPLAVLPLIALVFAARGSAAGLVSVFSLALLALPPLWVSIAVPLLAEREEWAFWAAFPGKAARLYRAGAMGLAFGLVWPALGGAGAAAWLLGARPLAAGLLAGSVVLVTVYWVAAAALASALVQEPPRALGLALAFWAALVLLYEPMVVALAVAFADWPLDLPLLAAIFANPMELARVSLLKALEVPVLVGPVGYLLDRLLGGWGYAGLLLTFGAWIGLFFALAGWVFARRDR